MKHPNALCANDGRQFISFSAEKKLKLFFFFWFFANNIFHFFFYSLNSPPSLAAIKMTLVKIYDFIYRASVLRCWAEHFRDLFLMLTRFIICFSVLAASLSISHRVSPADCMRQCSWAEVSAIECLCVLCVNFLGFIFISQTEQWAYLYFITCRQSETRQFQFFIFTGVRATRYKFYYCRAVGLITRLQFTAIAFDSPFITLLYMWPFGFFFSLMHTCRDARCGDWMSKWTNRIRKIIIKNNNGVH